MPNYLWELYSNATICHVSKHANTWLYSFPWFNTLWESLNLGTIFIFVLISLPPCPPTAGPSACAAPPPAHLLIVVILTLGYGATSFRARGYLTSRPSSSTFYGTLHTGGLQGSPHQGAFCRGIKQPLAQSQKSTK